MRRREIIALAAASVLGGAIGIAPSAWSQRLRGQKRVGLLISIASGPDGSVPASQQSLVDATRVGLREDGFIEGTNVTLDIGYGFNDPARIRAAAHDFAS